MTRKRTVLFFLLLFFLLLLFTSFFCAAQTGCIISYGPGAADNKIYTTSANRYGWSCDGWYTSKYNSTVYVPLQQNYVWYPDPTSRRLNNCIVGSSCGREGTFSQLPKLSAPIDTNIFLLTLAVGIIGYFAIYRRHHFA